MYMYSCLYAKLLSWIQKLGEIESKFVRGPCIPVKDVEERPDPGRQDQDSHTS